jgi:asparagine synthase (glutamine-hydrolysing)
MSDFLLDFRDGQTRQKSAGRAVSLLKFCDDTRARVLERTSFTLVVTRVDEFDLWGPYEDASPAQNLVIALAGRIALDQAQWDSARKIDGPGGLACKAISKLYREGGIDALGALNGNFAVFVYDAPAGRLHLVTDRCGMYLAYGCAGDEKPLVYGSHPDVLASVVRESQNWDMTSMAEFLMTSRLTFPYTYYRNIRALEPASIYTFGLQNGSATRESQRRYFHFDFKIDPRATEWSLAEELAAAFKNAVQRRTLPVLGRAGVGLSGGLDSRALLSAAGQGDHIRAFTLFDEENSELRVAKGVAEACGVEMIPIKREFEFYGNTAELGVRISGGTGCITCNHYLGVRERLRAFGIQSILTGCYCDYLLKGLALNTVEGKLSRVQKLADFKLEFYDSMTFFNTAAREGVLARLTALFPESGNGRLSGLDWLNVERKRTFPLAYEEDLAQRVIPQRVMPWYLPIVDNELINLYLRIPSRFKLNGSLFKKMLTLLAPHALCRIPDSNTGARVNASWPTRALHRYRSALQNRFSQRIRAGMATAGSWPNWRHYFSHSRVIESLWTRPNSVARELFIGIIGKDLYHEELEGYLDGEIVLFQRLLTLKLWLDQRTL